MRRRTHTPRLKNNMPQQIITVRMHFICCVNSVVEAVNAHTTSMAKSMKRIGFKLPLFSSGRCCFFVVMLPFARHKQSENSNVL